MIIQTAPFVPRHDIFPRVSPSLVGETTAALVRFENLLERALSRRPRLAPRKAWDDFFALPEARQQLIIAAWNSQSDFLEQAIASEVDCIDEPGMLHFAMGYLKLLGDAEIFGSVEKDDLVEILSPDFLQIYRSYNFFSLCNYSLLELGTYPFFELYGRTSKVETQLIRYGQQLLNGEAKWIDLSPIPDYTIRELLTKEGALFSMRERLLVRTISMQSGDTFIISIKKVKALDEGPSTRNIRFM